jgi:hypothetical protein
MRRIINSTSPDRVRVGGQLFDAGADRLTPELAESHAYGSGVVSLTYRRSGP